MENYPVQLKITRPGEEIPVWGALFTSHIPYNIGNLSIEEGKLVLRADFCIDFPIVGNSFTFEVKEIKPKGKEE